MSSYQFIASDKILKDVENKSFEEISINEALRRNIIIEDFILEDDTLDKNEPMVLVYESEDAFKDLSITHDKEPNENFLNKYTNKKYISTINWHISPKRIHQFYDVIKSELQYIDEIEIWGIWLDDYDPPDVRTVSIEDLNDEDLIFIDIHDGFDKNRCLIIKSN